MTGKSKNVVRGTAYNAMGPREQDCLELANQWARVTVTREDGVYLVDGDTESGALETYARFPDAVTAAWRGLAEYEKGRID